MSESARPVSRIHKLRNFGISLFVILWTLYFHYHSVRHFYLEPWLQRSLPAPKWLFPPAGWIMFYNVNYSYGFAEVYGIKEKRLEKIDPHLILRTRAVGYDNIKRNVLTMVLTPSLKEPFCGFLKKRLPHYEGYWVTYVQYSDLKNHPQQAYRQLVYECR